ncbi:hypothetical protein O181_050854 [Austropuccinia psidii MF-1]|uniref:Reverse transcriptase Ty1/copia-type domain-containing protein n=1 Tax=Austropuccinia psidii MF-1 TaxID=1389203 RepID=A0A9Q3DXM1_9BASI|nr:hypothetical protein [Austropuccinia psidii MF-1]
MESSWAALMQFSNNSKRRCRANLRLRIDQHLLADQIVSAYQRPVVHKLNQLPDEMLTSNDSNAINTSIFQSTIGSLMYLSNGTRPDISYAVHLLARFASNPGLSHWRALDHLIGYLSRHPHLSLSYGDTGKGFELWADANWGGDHQRSTSGYIIKVFGNVVAWGSKRQTVVAMSTCAAEYVALSEGSQLLSLLRLVGEPILGTQPISIYCDNREAILIADDNLSKKQTKYLDRAFYFVNDFIRAYKVTLKWVSSAEQQADILTKPLGAVKL